jgi:uncharacterized integral membrane protein (TIGR00698 family)
MFRQKIAFFIFIVACLTPYVSPPAALALGLFQALKIGNPYQRAVGRWTRLLLQTSVVLLGFGMSLSNVIKAGKDGILFTVATIFGTLLLGWLLGRLLKTGDKTSALISSGTAICGGSAIAAVAPAIEAEGEEISVSLATVFILNSAALIIFPYIGQALNLTENQFGIWAAIAIHDTSSVVGASAKYGAEALRTATTVKLARALWIAPIALFFAFIYGRKNGGKKTKIVVPWFIFLFLAASVCRTYAPNWFPPSIFDALINLAKAGLTVTLFFIGSSLSRETIRKVGIKPFLQGVLLWMAVSLASLWAIRSIL